MKFGDHRFTIEAYHEPTENEKGWVFGRMCCHIDNFELGDIEEPACMLNVTEGNLKDSLHHLNELESAELNSISDIEAFEYLDRALYIGEENLSNEEIEMLAKKYFKHDFLTNGGESFDNTKSFLVKREEEIRILFKNPKEEFYSGSVPIEHFEAVVVDFLNWIALEKTKCQPGESGNGIRRATS